jgi:hypothetical protein
VQVPDTGVICIENNCEIRSCGQKDRIAESAVHWPSIDLNRLKRVTVQVHRMVFINTGFFDPVDPADPTRLGLYKVWF